MKINNLDHTSATAINLLKFFRLKLNYIKFLFTSISIAVVHLQLEVFRVIIIVKTTCSAVVDIMAGASKIRVSMKPLFLNQIDRIRAIVTIIICLSLFCSKVFAIALQTSIVIHYKGEFDKNKLLKFQIYQNFALENYILVDPPKYEKKEGLNFIKYTFFLDHPQVLNVGFHSIYIEPGKNADLTYVFSGYDESKTPIESIISNDNESIILRKNGNSIYSKKELYDKLNSAKTPTQFSFFFDSTNIEPMINRNVKEIYEKNIKSKETTLRDQYFKEIIFEDYLITILKKFDYFKQSLSEEDQNIVIEKAALLIQSFSNKLNVKSFQYYLSLQELYRLKYQASWKLEGYQPGLVMKSLNSFDAVSKEYLILNIFKQNLVDVDRDTLNLGDLKSEVTIITFKNYLERYLAQKNVGDIANGFISNELRNLVVYNSQNQKILFGDLFSKTNQKFLYFDFCGSWCQPCLLEIETYTNSERTFDHSDLVRPIWLFFENNHLDWLKTIAKFDLPEENCYLVIDPTLQRYFFDEFEWKGEFPHHFVFQNNGHIIDNNANNLMYLNEKKLEENSKAIKMKQSLISLPPSNKKTNNN